MWKYAIWTDYASLFRNNHVSGQNLIYYFLPRKSSLRKNKLWNRFEIRIKINKEVTRKRKKTDIYAAVSVPRKNWRPATYRNWFWHGTSVFWSGSWRRTKRQRGKKTRVSGKRIRIGSSGRCPDEDLRLSNFISVQVGAGLLGIETTMLFTPIPTDDC